MLEAQNQTIAHEDNLEMAWRDGFSDATQMIQDHAEEIAILEAYRDSLLIELENSNNTSAELIVQLVQMLALGRNLISLLKPERSFNHAKFF